MKQLIEVEILAEKCNFKIKKDIIDPWRFPPKSGYVLYTRKGECVTTFYNLDEAYNWLRGYIFALYNYSYYLPPTNLFLSSLKEQKR